ncbi:MAG: DUF1772 domain-containing protein [Flavobacterium lindanitolerans]|uniref:DUF1772 domain-containing protein n=1 Tax=Flavobacterium lindanitolerans TaxID=428988 RepID=UPI001A4062EF|nr:DUF1772 domain-containing protein [Flavobacterium lindanitolerans]MBL7869451.1 DUF1772 domain-containing protein [Flavobacterium lindanitolerans]
MKKLVLYAAIALSSGLFFTNIYNSIVNAANWESNIPYSIKATKDFFTVANPGSFFKLIDLPNLVLMSLALILFWKHSTSIRLYLGFAIVCFISSLVLTFTYFYPRNEIMFLSEQVPDTETLKRVAAEWGRMNWIRSLIWLVGLICTFLALDRATSSTRPSI